MYGIPGNVDIIWGALEGAISGIPGATVKVTEDLGENPIWKNREQAMRGLVTPQKDKPSANHGCIRFTLGAAIEGSDATANRYASATGTQGVFTISAEAAASLAKRIADFK